MRNAARTDANQPSIVSALRAVGCKVLYIKKPLDLLVAGGPLKERNVLLEVKMWGEKLNAEQQEFWDGWPGEKHLVYSERQALEIVLGKDVFA